MRPLQIECVLIVTKHLLLQLLPSPLAFAYFLCLYSRLDFVVRVHNGVMSMDVVKSP